MPFLFCLSDKNRWDLAGPTGCFLRESMAAPVFLLFFSAQQSPCSAGPHLHSASVQQGPQHIHGLHTAGRCLFTRLLRLSCFLFQRGNSAVSMRYAFSSSVIFAHPFSLVGDSPAPRCPIVRSGPPAPSGKQHHFSCAFLLSASIIRRPKRNSKYRYFIP